MSVVRFNCILCGASCGMLATVADGRIANVKGDRDHPDSRGYTCVKGRSIAAQHHGANRIDRPRSHGRTVAWEDLLDDVAATIARLRAEGGPDCIAGHIGHGAQDPPGKYAMRRLLAGLESNQLYSAATLDVAPALRAAELVTGFPTSHPVWTPDDESPGLVILVGVNPTVSGGYVGTPGSNWFARLRAFHARGGELWVIDPRRTKTARHADRHLASRPGTDALVFGWLVRELLEHGYDAAELGSACDPTDVERLRAAVEPFELASVSAQTDISECDLTDLLAAIRRHGKVGILAGTGVSFAPSGVLAYWLIWAVMIITGSLDHEDGLRFLAPGRAALDAPPLTGHAPEEGSYAPGPASRPDLAGLFGERPAVALVDEIEAGEIRALLLFGGKLLTSCPDPERMREALAKLELLVVLDVAENEMTELATHVAPCAWITERSHFIYLPYFGMSRAYLSPSVVAPTANRRHSWWVLAQLGRRLGVDVFDGELDPDMCHDEAAVRHVAELSCDYFNAVSEAGPSGTDVPFRYGWFHSNVLPGGRWRLAPRVLVDRLPEVWENAVAGDLRLVCGRILGSVNSVSHNAVQDGPPDIHVSADAARAYAVGTGDQIRVSNSFGSVAGRACVDDALAPRSIWLSHGWLAQNANRLTDGMNVDRMTGQPAFTGLAVELERVGI